MLLVAFDIHHNIFSAQGLIQYTTSKPASHIEVAMKSDCICLIIYINSTVCQKFNIALPKDLIQPCTASSICCQNPAALTVNKEDNMLLWTFLFDKNLTFKATFRIQISEKYNLDKYITRKMPIVKFKDFMKDKFKVFQVYNVICTNCNNLLSEKQISFQSIHDYHENMSELSDTWFCHQHDAQQCFEPKSDSLYIGDTLFYLHDSVIGNLRLSISNKVYKCIKCHSILSLRTKMNNPNYIGFFCDKIMLQEPKISLNNAVSMKYRNDVALLLFYNIFEDVLKSAVTCKIYLQCKVEEQTECLLLWANSPKIVQLLLHEMNNDESSTTTELNAQEVFKVLYSSCAPDSEVAKKWKHDFSVDFFQVSDSMIKCIKELLKESLKSSSGEPETVDGFSFGYLPVYTYDACVT